MATLTHHTLPGGWAVTARHTPRTLTLTAEDEGQPYGSITLRFNGNCPDGSPALAQGLACMAAALVAYNA